MAASHKNKIKYLKDRNILSLVNSRCEKVSLYGLSILLAAWLSGCSTVDPKPFQTFNEAANQITIIDTIVDGHTSTVKETELAKIAQDASKVKALGLDFDTSDPFKHQFKFKNDKEPLFIKWQRFDSALAELNSAFIEYTRLLSALADGDLIETEEFDQLAADLNTNVRSALESLGVEPGGSSTALFSTAASAAAHSYISYKRKQYLIDIINNNQNSVEAFIDHAQSAVAILARDIQDPYLGAHRELLTRWVSSKKVSDKRKIADKIYSNSKITGTTLEMLRSLDRTYKSLAENHRKLAVGLENGQFSVSAFKANIKRLQKLYKKLKNATEEKSVAVPTKKQVA